MNRKFLWIFPVLAAASLCGFWIKPGYYVRPETLFLQMAPAAGALLGLLLPDFLCRFQERKSALLPWVCAAAAAAWLIWVNHHVLLSFMNSADEFSCYFFAQLLAAGKFWTAPHPAKDFFETAHVGAIGGKWFSVYPPGWPLVWAAGLKFHLKDSLNPVLAALCIPVLADTGRRIYGRCSVLFLTFFLLISPFFVLNAAAYYSHNLCLLLVVLYWNAALRWEERGSLLWASAAGFALGYALGTRYLTAAALGFLPAAHMGWEALRRKRLGTYFVFCAVTGLFIAAQLVYNRLLTGGFLNAPNHYLHPHEKLGFIPGYPPSMALEYLGKRFLYLIDWTPPAAVLVFLLGAGLKKTSGAWDGILRASIFLLPAAYFFYYSWGGNQYGPRYYLEAYPFLLLFLDDLRHSIMNESHFRVKKAAAGFLIAAWAASAPLLRYQFEFFSAETHARKAVYELAERETKKPALVFMKGFFGSERLSMAPEDTVRNSPFLNGTVLYAHDREGENVKLIPFFPDRHYYRAVYDSSQHRPRLEEAAL